MNRMMRVLLVCVAVCVVGGGAETPEKKKSWVKAEPLSRLQHDDEHNHDFDHQAFLGEEEAHNFQQLPPEESVRRLGELVDRMDVDGDGVISEGELSLWVSSVQVKSSSQRVEAQWHEYDADADGFISWDEFRNATYGSYMDDPDMEAEFNYTEVMWRDERRFKAADTDGDDKADALQFNAFLHPENYQHMQDLVVQETIEETDKNNDGFIDLDEFIDQMYSPETDGEAVPPWVEKQRQEFTELKDTNKDKKLDKQEVKDSLFPPGMSAAEAEAKHLIQESDADQDGKLTKQEILDKHEVFVGSQATDYGEVLMLHDEF